MSVIPLRVAIRARPLIPKEVDEGCQTCLTFVPGEPQIVLGKNRSFTYDYVFSSTDPQIIVYEDAVKPIVKTIFKGYNATVLAYGQTGSGKTFTMGGGYEASLKMDPEGMGVIPRILQEVFNGMKDRHENYEYKIFVSYLEIINEELHDLLVNGKNNSLTIREENGEIKIPGLKEIETKDAEDTMRCLEQGCSNRTTAATAMNSTSSRSHAIFTVYIEQKHREDTNDFWRAKLQLVDLAGSERVKKTHAEGERLKEGININKGLLSLGNVISALGDETQKKLHIPYRDSKLTRILQDSLGGNSHTLMIACVSPADSNMEETLNTMRYADRARKIKNKPVVNWDPQTAEIMRLKEVVQQLTMKMIHHGLTDITTSSTTSSTPTTSPKQTNNAEAIRSWMDKCKALEDENNSLSKELRHSVDQTASVCEKAIKWEMKCDRLTSRLQVINENVGVDFDLLSATMTAESNPLIAEQLEKLKAFASNINESVETEETENNSALEEEDDNKDENDEMEASTPESREIVKQHTLRRAKMNTELEELNKILEKKEKLASQMCQNDNKMQAMRDQYENTMKLLEDEVSGLQKEKENLSSALEDARTNTAASKVSEQRRKRLQELETQICDLRKKMVEQKKVLKLKEQSDKQVSKLNTEIQALKQQRVRLMKQMKEDADTWRKFRQQKDKEVLQLQQKDRKRQFEIQKLQRENQRTQTVLHRKAEEAAAANRRLKEALAKQKKVLEERNQKFEKCDNTTIGNRVRKWLSHEMDVRVGIHEAKYHRESLLQDRKTMAEDLKTLKESLDDDGPPSKRMAWMDDSGQKCETSFKEEDTKKKIHEVQQQIELRNVQIADLQQKIFDAEQECRGKSAKDNMHTMMEAKISIKWLLDQAVSYKADNNRLRLEIQDLRENIEESGTDNNRYIDDLEHDNDELKRTHQSTIIKLRHEHQKEIEILLASAQQVTTSDPDMQRRLDMQKDEIKKLNELNEQLRKKTEQCDTMEKHLTKYMYKDKSVALMPDLTDDDDQPPEARSPFLNMRPKPKRPAPKGGKKKLQMEEYVCEGEDMEEEEIAYNDPTWTPISKGNRAEGPHTRMSRRRKTDLFKQPEIGKTDNTNKLPNIDDNDNNDNRTPDNTATSSVLNTTFEVEPSVSSEEGQIPEVSDKITTKPPLRMRKQHSRVSRPALEIIQTDNIRSSDEFEKPMRKSASASNLRKKSSSSSLRKKSSTGNLRKKSSSSDLSKTSLGDETSVLLEGLQKKKRKLHNTKDSFFSPPE